MLTQPKQPAPAQPELSKFTQTAPPTLTFLARVFRGYDRAWRRWHRVEAFDAMVSLSLTPYRGQSRTLPDGTFLQRGDTLGVIHFNHDSFSRDTNRLRAALRFRRQFTRSLQDLTSHLATDSRLQHVKALYGESWIKPHGHQLGFIIEPLPKTWRTQLQHTYVRLLLRILFPHLRSPEHSTGLNAYWFTRRQFHALPQRLENNRIPRD